MELLNGKYDMLSGADAFNINEVLDKNGKSVRILHNNQVLGTEGKITWDGKDNQGQLLPVGYYVFNIKLYSKQIRHTKHQRA